MPKVVIAITAAGVKAIYSPASANLLQKLGSIAITRASHVEPGSNLSSAAFRQLYAENRWREDSRLKWFADMSPTTKKMVVLGPFDTNTEAIEAEVAFLQEYMRTEAANQTCES